MTGTTVALPALAADDIQIGPRVIVNGTRHAIETQAEAAYVDALYGRLAQASRYPTGREASLTQPRGTTTVWVDVSRDGTVAGRGIERSSGSALLDDTARTLVGRATYAALPADAWSDGPTHRFVVRYRFDGRDASTVLPAFTRFAGR